MRDTKLIFVEGINGSGKSTTAQFITDRLTRRQVRARLLPEGGRGHPLRVAASLPHPLEVWRDVTAEQFVAASLRKWHTFAQAARQAAPVTVCDGLLLHGNMMDLLLLDSAPELLQSYVAQVVETVRELKPVLVYFYQADVSDALRRIAEVRGPDWIALQANWKLPSPYGRRRGLASAPTPESQFSGLVELYSAYREASDLIVPALPVPALRIENTAGDWPEYYRDILNFLELPTEAGQTPHAEVAGPPARAC